MFNAIGYINTSRKKKNKFQLIPASYFKKETNSLKELNVVDVEKIDTNEVKVEAEQPTDLAIQSATYSKTTNEHQVSALSLKSIKKKRELEATINPVNINLDDLPKDSFTFEKMKEHWDFCSEQYYKTGRMLMSSTMNMAKLTLNEHLLMVEFPNEGSKLSFEENLYDLVSYIHKKLNNYHLKIEVKVNETVQVSKVYTIDDKLNYLKEINPVLNQLIKSFDLDIKI